MGRGDTVACDVQFSQCIIWINVTRLAVYFENRSKLEGLEWANVVYFVLAFDQASQMSELHWKTLKKCEIKAGR